MLQLLQLFLSAAALGICRRVLCQNGGDTPSNDLQRQRKSQSSSSEKTFTLTKKAGFTLSITDIEIKSIILIIK